MYGIPDTGPAPRRTGCALGGARTMESDIHHGYWEGDAAGMTTTTVGTMTATAIGVKSIGMRS